MGDTRLCTGRIVRRDDKTTSKRNGRQENGKDMLEEGNDRGLAPKTQIYWWGEKTVQGEWGSGCKEIPFTVQFIVMTTVFCSSSELLSYT